LFARSFPYMLWVHQQPGHAAAHLHVHVSPPLRGAHTMRYVAAGELGSGTLFNPVIPETAAAALRGA
jgi:UDPglucose--hexose-1-phosphate uridylyltransferase